MYIFTFPILPRNLRAVQMQSILLRAFSVHLRQFTKIKTIGPHNLTLTPKWLNIIYACNEHYYEIPFVPELSFAMRYVRALYLSNRSSVQPATLRIDFVPLCERCSIWHIPTINWKGDREVIYQHALSILHLVIIPLW